MIFVEILVAVSAIAIVIAVFSKFIYNKMHGIDTECEECKKRTKKEIKKIRKELNIEFNNK